MWKLTALYDALAEPEQFSIEFKAGLPVIIVIANQAPLTPEREFVTSDIPASQRTVNGTVHLKLCKGNVVVIGRSPDEVTNLIHCLLCSSFACQGLDDEHQSSMDQLGGFEPTGFIQIESIRIEKRGQVMLARVKLALSQM
ncbi:uncharacterized protein EDB91DRAFT_1137165 [Suillus paluster]|uniref:uncharacterized protein n=1 Tax=Suillus paluster TaxID=48578 RepID=UPI001B8837C8|nr:uncharacterized protein EDB91DRAFT_1137165 [Suillus paluster]KAG1738891.1 hypothetical protein EDB91DRAFT_1137165 [Suillus paluster]